MDGEHGQTAEPADSGSASGGLSESCLEDLISSKQFGRRALPGVRILFALSERQILTTLLQQSGLPLLFPGIMRFTVTLIGTLWAFIYWQLVFRAKPLIELEMRSSGDDIVFTWRCPQAPGPGSPG